MADIIQTEISANTSDRFLRISDVAERVAMGVSTIYRKMDEGTFPEPYEIDDEGGAGDGGVRWKESEVKAWIDSRPRRRRARMKQHVA